MKKIFTFTLLFLSCLVCTACINNAAISELNRIGKEYYEQGKVDEAIARFSSCVDLDENVFESRYNLGVAYMQKGEYDKAREQLEAALKISPDNEDVQYSLDVLNQNEEFDAKKKEDEPEVFE